MRSPARACTRLSAGRRGARLGVGRRDAMRHGVPRHKHGTTRARVYPLAGVFALRIAASGRGCGSSWVRASILTRLRSHLSGKEPPAVVANDVCDILAESVGSAHVNTCDEWRENGHMHDCCCLTQPCALATSPRAHVVTTSRAGCSALLLLLRREPCSLSLTCSARSPLASLVLLRSAARQPPAAFILARCRCCATHAPSAPILR